MEKIKETIQKTNGKKTTTAVVLYLLVEALKLWKPDLMGQNAEHLVMLTINSGLIGGLVHKIIRNRKQISKYIVDKLKSLKRA